MTQQLVNGLNLGAAYAIVAVGYTLIFGVLNVLNFAHGQVVMLGAFAGILGGEAVGGGLVAMLAGGALGAAVAGIAILYLAIRPVGKSFLGTFLATLGAAIVLEWLATQIWGVQIRTVADAGLSGQVEVLGAVLNANQLLILGVSALMLVAFAWMVQRSQLGRELRAIAEDEDMAASLGVNVRSRRLWTVAIASAIGGIAGVLLGISQGTIAPTMGNELALKALIIIIVGGLGSVQGAVIVALALGMAEVGTVAAGHSELKDLIGFVLLIAVLLLRPSGLMGSQAAVSRP